MKKLILLAVICCFTALMSCNDKKKLTLDPSTPVILNGQLALCKAIPEPPYSLATITKHAFEMGFQTDTPPAGSRRGGLIGHDLVNNKIRVGEFNEIVTTDNNGNPKLGYFTTCNMQDIVLLAARRENEDNWVNAYEWIDLNLGQLPFPNIHDTIGYIPNRVVEQAETAIHSAFEAGDYEECMRLFEQAYIFIPITGAEWRALKAKGEQ